MSVERFLKRLYAILHIDQSALNPREYTTPKLALNLRIDTGSYRDDEAYKSPPSTKANDTSKWLIHEAIKCTIEACNDGLDIGASLGY
jgi:hypothetical protein